MLRRPFFLLALVLSSHFLTAQLKIAGANFDLGSGTISVIRWDANAGSILDSVPTPTGGIAIGSSVFDAYHGKYYFAGGGVLNGVGFGPNTFASLVGTSFNTSTEIDMASGKIFGLRQINLLDSNGVFISSSMNMVEYDITTNTESVMGTFAGNQGAYLDASCYNSNLGIYYFVGNDSALGQCLYAVNTTAPAFAFTVVPLNFAGMYAVSMEYDNENDLLYALIHFVGIPGSEHFMIQKINPATGALTMEADFPQFGSYQLGSCSFHQASSSMVFVLPDSTGRVLRIYNTVTDSLTSGILPMPLINEFECDNTEFAAAKYNTTTVKSPIAAAVMMLYPNPAGDELRVVASEQVLHVQVVDARGHMAPLPTSEDMTQIDVSSLAPGYYILRSLLADGSWSQGKFVKL
jgi:Secretion system C-terminal sorting domain